MRYLLDVNVLLALAWPNHQFHAAAQSWFGTESKAGWATCATTQLGFIRLSSNPAFTSAAVSPAQAAALLSKLCEGPQHCFLESPSVTAVSDFSWALGHKQVTDAYLMALACQYQCELVTFDQRLQGLGRPQNLRIISPDF